MNHNDERDYAEEADNRTLGRDGPEWNDHVNQLGDWCPWSGKPAGADEGEPCPALCPASRAVEFAGS